MFDYSITAYITEDLKTDHDLLYAFEDPITFGSPFSSSTPSDDDQDEPQYRFENPVTFASNFSCSPDRDADQNTLQRSSLPFKLNEPLDTSSELLAQSVQRKGDWESFINRMTPEKRALIEKEKYASRRRFSSVKPQSTHSRTYVRLPTPNSSSDEDADGDSDDEYIPSPDLSSNKRLRSESVDYVEVKQEFSRLSFPSSTKCRPVKRIRVSPPARNKPSPSSLIPVIQKALKDGAACDELRNICPVCHYEQENRRMPDFRRHMETHLPEGRFWCSGVPVEVAHQYGIPAGAKSFWFQGEERVGGCGKSFSRRDARKRHLDNPNIGCVKDCVNDH